MDFLSWRCDLSAEEWDSLLVEHRGHPLQSGLWADAKSSVGHANSKAWVAYEGSRPLVLARVEERRLLGRFKLAWVPKGPIFINPELRPALVKEFFNLLKKEGFLVCAINPYIELDSSIHDKSPHQTLWVDLKIGEKKLYENFSKQLRYNINYAKKAGVAITKAVDKQHLSTFYELCVTLSQLKNFAFNFNFSFLERLFDANADALVTGHLFIALYQDEFCGGAFIIRCGNSIHYMWGGVKRCVSAKAQVGEALQWEVMRWGVENKFEKYDLEGIDPEKNPGVYHFKKKFSQETVYLEGESVYLLGGWVNPRLPNFNKLSALKNRFVS